MRTEADQNGKVYVWRELSSEELPGYGDLPADLMIIGLCPSTRRPESRRLMPFGSKYFPIVQKFEEKYRVYCTNLVSIAHDPGTKLKEAEISRELDSLNAEIKLANPRVILTFSQETAKALLNDVDLREDHGTYFFKDGRIIIPTYHPAAERSQEIKLELARDLVRTEWALDHGKEIHLPEYELDVPFVSSTVILDIETRGLYKETELIGLAPEEGKPVIFRPQSFGFALEVLKSAEVIVGHNLSYDLAVLSQEFGFRVRSDQRLVDTMVAAHLQGSHRLSLKSLSTDFIDFPGSRAWKFYPERTLEIYLALDLEGTRRLYFDAKRNGTLFSALMHWVKIAASTASSGVFCEVQNIPQVLESTKQEMNKLSEKWKINLASTKQVSELLRKRGAKLPETEKGNFSVKESVLLELEDEAATDILNFRATSKIAQFLSQYLYGAKGNFLFPKLKICGTETGRFSCEDPNLQQVPRTGMLKTLFTSRYGDEGSIFLMDLSQAELRAAAFLSGDQGLIRSLQTQDVHRYIASLVFKKREDEITATERKWSKRVVFGILYGGSPSGLSEKFGIPEREIRKIYQEIQTLFPRLSNYLREIQRNPPTKVVTITGRVRDLSPLFPDYASAAIRKAINTPIQSLASDFILLIGAFSNQRFEERNLKARVLFPIHDSLFIDLKSEEIDEVAEIIGSAFLRLKTIREFRNLCFSQLALVGEGKSGKSWASVESTNEYYAPQREFIFSTDFGFSEVTNVRS